MKKLPYYLLFLIAFSYVSCSNESIEEIVADVEEEVEEEDNNEEEEEDTDITSDNPCDFDLLSIAANSTVTIDCLMDLEGKTINLPANVNFDFEGGDIFNGTLVFSGGYIDGRLLNFDLETQGDVMLKSPTFMFTASRWENIVQGQTTSDIALQNTAEFEKLMFRIKDMGGTTFKTDVFDAFFEITKVTSTTANQNFYASVEAVNIPSDFHLKMSDNTHLRTFTAESGIENGVILAVRDVDNVIVSGGNLYGDRDKRVYSPEDVGLEGTHLFHIHASRNITLDGINFINGSKGGLNVYSLGFSFNPDYIPTTKVTIKNCLFKNNRRMALAVTDGRDVTIEGNTFIDSGQPSANSDGGEVGYAINVEAYRRRDANGNLVENEKAFDIDIKNNTEINSRVGFVSVHIGQQVTVQNNTVSTRVVYSLASETKILNNTFVANSGSDEQFAIFAAGEGETVFDNEIAGNDISGYNVGIATDTKDVYVHDNEIRDCEIGLQMNDTFDSDFEGNTISANNFGIGLTNTACDNLNIMNNDITAQGFHIKFSNFNQKDDDLNNMINIEQNNFFTTKKVSFSTANGVIFKNNEVVGGIEIGNSSNISIINNQKIEPAASDGIRLYGTHENIVISNNNIAEPDASQYNCIKNNSENPAEITLASNSCN
ncbi:right-handed parallel beta-helix repeat-containing protein [uncultured Aquimarina sp.]|uniref:right-handed parallel beta-helix repeat-containing protein n=1 Tax=uncultured Aquimarina sp. TaxID=575652 RepID=UPI00262D604A|nr:right-handed parallel beta-helix repeat-containing protein [uncultured Aquimarina sp.]